MQATVRYSQPAPWCVVVVSTLLGGLACLAQEGAPAPTGKIIVADVIPQGSHLVSNQQIMAYLKTRPGSEYKQDVVQEDVRTLYATKQFANIEVITRNEADGRVTVIFLIRDYPSKVENVVYQGAKHLKDDDLTTLTNIRKGSPLNPIANKLACQAIVRKYNEQGRPFASCQLLKGDQPGDTEVIFNITEGPVVCVRSIRFTGADTFVSGSVLMSHIHTSRKVFGLFGGKFQSQMLDADIAKLEEYYKGFGFLDVRIARELQYTPDGRDVDIVFHVHEGVRYQVKDIPQVSGLKSILPEQGEQLNKVRPGMYYEQSKIDGDINRIKDYVGYGGHEVQGRATPVYSTETPGLVTVQYEFEERAQARVGQIFIVGDERTRQNVILRQLGIYPGQVLSYPDLRFAEKNLARLNIFEVSPDGAIRPTVTVLDPDSDSEIKDILVTVQEANTGSLMFGVGVNSNAGLTGNIVLNERNFDITKWPGSIDELLSGNAFRGAGQEFRIEAVPGTQLQRYTVSWREPFLFDSLFSLGVSAYYYTRQYNEYDETRVGSKVTLGRKLNQYWTATGTIRVEDVGVFGVADYAPQEFQEVKGENFLAGFRAGLQRDSRDSYLRPTQGSLFSISYEEVVGDRIFPLVNAEFNDYFTIYQRADGSGRQVLAFRSAAGWAGENTPVFERFYAGGYSSIRGFAFRGVGPEEIGYKTGGTFMFLNSLEYQVPLLANDMVYAVGFVDSGTVESKLDIRDYRVSAGFGLRFVVPMLGPVPIALDFGFPIVRASTDNNQVFSFFMGFTR